MTRELAPKQAISTGEKLRALATSVSWLRLALVAALILSALLNLLWLPSEGYTNTYYAATVKNMLTSPYNFFFVSYDAGSCSWTSRPWGSGSRPQAPGCSACTDGPYCFPRLWRASSPWHCSTTWCDVPSDR